MTRRATLLACGLAAMLVLLGLQSWGVAVDRIERHVIGAIEDRTGLTVTGLERAEIALLPLPRISLSNVSFKHRDGRIGGTALRLRARARLLSLVSGDLSFDRIDLAGPQIDVAVAGTDDGLGDWLATPLAYLQDLRSQSRIVISSGSVFMRAQGSIRTILRDVNLAIQERVAADPLVVSGSINWRGVPTEISLVWPMAGDGGRLTLAATSPLMTLRFDGVSSGRSEPVVNGALLLSTRSLPELLDWFGDRPRLAAAIGALTLSGQAQIKPREATLGNVVAQIDGERLDGAVKLAETGGRWAVSGTLAGAELDLGRLYAKLEVPPLPQSLGETAPLDFEAWTAHDIDLRISVDAARLNRAKLSEVATYLLVKKGRFEAGILRAGAYGGSARGRLLAVATPAGVDVKLQAGLDKISLSQAGADLPELPRLSGAATLQIGLDGVGSSVEDIVASLSGKASLGVRQGELGGFAFADLMRRTERNPALTSRDWRQGRTAFESASLNAVIANGVATVADGQMSGATYRIGLMGHVSLPARWIDMSAVLSPPTGALRIPFALRGPLDAPSLELDTDAPPRPSGAAFPTQPLR